MFQQKKENLRIFLTYFHKKWEKATILKTKAKTLAEKRRKLQEDMVKYGVAAIERMYPRQGRKMVAPVNTKNKNKPKETI